MNPIVVKQTAILSAILGGILGVVTLIPFIRNFSFMILIFCISAVILVYMKRHDLIGIIDVKEGAILGAIIGFISFIAFSIVYIPLVALTGLIFKGYYTFGILEMLRTGMGGLFVLIMIIVFLAFVISALMNAFAGLVTAYVYELLSGVKKEQNESIEFEIKE